MAASFEGENGILPSGMATHSNGEVPLLSAECSQRWSVCRWCQSRDKPTVIFSTLASQHQDGRQVSAVINFPTVSSQLVSTPHIYLLAACTYRVCDGLLRLEIALPLPFCMMPNLMRPSCIPTAEQESCRSATMRTKQVRASPPISEATFPPLSRP